MLTVILECRNHEPELTQTLSVLVTGAVEGLVRDVIILDLGGADGVARIADAAGCHYHTQWDIKDIVRNARGSWLLFVEPGARPQPGWIDGISEHILISRMSAQFSPARGYRQPLIKQLLRSTPPLELGLLIAKEEALAKAEKAETINDMLKGQKPKRLSAELIPSWVLRAKAR